MTQEDKELLLRDLCARIPYHTLVQLNPGAYDKPETCLLTGVHGEKVHLNVDSDPFRIASVKPYLRSMSSMTKEEREEIEVFIFNKWYEEDSCKIDGEGWIEILANYDVSGIDPKFCGDYVDWLNAHHFDFRGLIPLDLALEAPEGMYKTE